MEVQLRPWQVIGVNKVRWLCEEGPARRGTGTDEMGKGKTIQTIIACMDAQKRVRGVCDLVIVEPSLIL
jgi:SNF2 family DNA or RNA helicase